MKPEPCLNALVYGLPDMDMVTIRNIEYREHDGKPLTMDSYYPPGLEKNARLPVVIFVMGYMDSSPIVGGPLKDIAQYQSWGRLTAASGMVAITYQTMHHDDLSAVVKYIRRNAEALYIDEDNIGLWSCSGNTLTAEIFAMDRERDYLKFVVFYYGFILSPDNRFREGIDELCSSRGCYGPELGNVKQLLPKLPLFIVRAGQDSVPFINDSIDHFVRVALGLNVRLTLINYPEGIHAFDLEEWWPATPHFRSAEIVAQTVEFMRSKLAVK
jgi:hypothetical protein